MQNEPPHLGKGRRGWKEEAGSQRVIAMILDHNIRGEPARRGMSEVWTDLRFVWV